MLNNLQFLKNCTLFVKTTTHKFNKMKKAIKILGLLMMIFSVTALVSCSRDDDPVDNDFFAGTYKGKITYSDSEKKVSVDEGKILVTKIASGTKYNFTFSDGIPALNGVEFKQTGDNTLVSVGDVTAYIKIDKNTLVINYLKDGRAWVTNATR